MTSIYLVRHGRTIWNKELVFRGQADVPLDDFGRKQARCAGEALRDVELAAIHASPLSRARETAEAVAEHQTVEVAIDPAFNDFDCGKFQGMALDAAREAYPDVYKTWEESPHTVEFPEGGRLDDVTQLAMPRLRELARVHDGRAIAVVTHRVVLKVILCQVQWGDNSHFWEVKLDTAGISLLEPEGDALRVVSQNDTSHLAALGDAEGKADF